MSCRPIAGLLALTLGALAPLPLQAQADEWITREQQATWVGVFAEEALTSRTSLWFDGSWRRMGLGERPQQLLLRPGVIVALAPGVRVGAGYSYIATAPYGALPIARPTREHRGWQDLYLTHKAGRVNASHRFRLEQRWITPNLASGRGATTYANRFRYRARGTLPIQSLQLNGQPIYTFAWDELLMPIGGKAQRFTLGQNRATVGVGVPLGKTMQAEVGYMNLYNAFPTRRANEVNHTLWVSWHYTGTSRRR
jgi:hypothetical protein